MALTVEISFLLSWEPGSPRPRGRQVGFPWSLPWIPTVSSHGQPPCTHSTGVSLYSQISCSYKDTSQNGLGHTPGPHFNLITSWKGLASKHSHILRSWKFLASAYECWGTQFNPLKLFNADGQSCFDTWGGKMNIFSHELKLPVGMAPAPKPPFSRTACRWSPASSSRSPLPAWTCLLGFHPGFLCQKRLHLIITLKPSTTARPSLYAGVSHGCLKLADTGFHPETFCFNWYEDEFLKFPWWF